VGAGGLTWDVIGLAVLSVMVLNVAIWLVYLWARGEASLAAFGVQRGRLVTPRQEIEHLKAAVALLQSEIQSLKAPKSTASPYNQAMELLQKGLSVSDVAATCGITRGEAELLVALFRKSKTNDVG